MKTFSTFFKALVSSALITVSMSLAHAGVLNFSGDTTDSPVYNRTNGTTLLSLTGTAVHYQGFAFTVDGDDNYIIQTTSANWQSQDTVISLYVGSFNPAAPLTNIIAYNDDISGVGLSRIIQTLSPSTDYFLVVTAFNNAMFGTFTGTITGEEAGTARLTQGEVPLPSSLALLGLGAVMLLRRRSN